MCISYAQINSNQCWDVRDNNQRSAYCQNNVGNFVKINKICRKQIEWQRFVHMSNTHAICSLWTQIRPHIIMFLGFYMCDSSAVTLFSFIKDIFLFN